MKSSAWCARPCAWRGGLDNPCEAQIVKMRDLRIRGRQSQCPFLPGAGDNSPRFGFHHGNSCFVSHRDTGRGLALIIQCVDHPMAGDRVAGKGRMSDVNCYFSPKPADFPADLSYEACRQ